jgi:hypothetical protein
MAERWAFAFRVNATQDFETRYQEVYGGQIIPPDCAGDVAACHDMALAFVNTYSYQKPYAVYLSGTHDYETAPAVTVNVSVQNSP